MSAPIVYRMKVVASIIYIYICLQKIACIKTTVNIIVTEMDDMFEIELLGTFSYFLEDLCVILFIEYVKKEAIREVIDGKEREMAIQYP